MKTEEQCKAIIKNLSWKIGVSPRLIVTRFLSDDDKMDMKNGVLSQEELEVAIRAWIQNGMCDYAHGSNDIWRLG